MADDASDYRELMAQLEAAFASEQPRGLSRFEGPMTAPPEVSGEQGLTPKAWSSEQAESTSGGVNIDMGPVSGGARITANEAGKPVNVGLSANAGPVGYQYAQSPDRRAAASGQHTFSLNIDPRDAAMRLQAILLQNAQGQRSYGLGTGGEGWNVQGMYDPQRRDLQISGGMQKRFAEGGPFDEDTYGPSNIEERLARLEERLAAEQTATARYSGDELEAPQGYITPAKAARWVNTDAGPMAVDAEGNSLPLIQQPGVLPLYRDPTIDAVRMATPRMLDITGDMMGAPLGMTARRVIQAGIKGERPAANVIAAMGAEEIPEAVTRRKLTLADVRREFDPRAGEGMKGYYDKIVPTQLSKLVKKLDPEAKIEMGRLPVQGETRLAPDIARELGMTVEQIQALPHEQRSALINSVRHSIAAPSLTITPKMREAILSGQTAFAEGGSVQDSGATEAADLDTLFQKYADPGYAEGGSVPGYAFGGMFNDLFEGTKNIRKKWFGNPYATPAFTDSQATQDEQPATNEDKGLTQLAANYGEGAGGQAETIPSTVGSETEQPYLGGDLIMTEEENKQYDDLINSQQGEPPSFGPDNIPLPTRKPTYLQNFDYSQYANPLAARYAFLSKALNPTIAAAAMGNFQVESGNNPNQLQTSNGALTGKPLYTKEKGFENLPTGYGSAQWGTTRLTNLGANDPNKLGLYDFADRYGLDPNTTEGQDRFLVYELTTNPEYRNVYKNLLKSGNDVAGATYIFGSGYEAPKNLNASLKQRQQDALMYQNLYTNGLDKLTDAQRQRVADTQKNILDPYFNKLAEDKAALEKEQYDKWFEDQKSAFFKRTDEINAKAEADAKAKADAEAAEKARVQDQVAQNNNDLGDVGFNPVVDTSVNDRIMADSNALLDQSVQSGLNYSYQDPFGLLSSGLSQYVLPETYSSSGRPGGGNDGTGTQLSISPDFPSWYTEPFAEGGSVGFKPMFDGDSEMLQARAKQLARQAYENPKSLSASERKEWNELAGKYNLPPSAGSQNTYEEQTEETMSGLQKGLSSRQKEREYAKGGLVYDPAEIDAIAAQIRGAI